MSELRERLDKPYNLRNKVLACLLTLGAMASFVTYKAYESGKDQGYAAGYEQGLQQGTQQQKAIEAARDIAEEKARNMTFNLANGNAVEAKAFNGILIFGNKEGGSIDRPLFLSEPNAVGGALFIGYQRPDKDGNPGISVLQYDPQSGMRFHSEDYRTMDVELSTPLRGGGDIYAQAMTPDGQVIVPGVPIPTSIS